MKRLFGGFVLAVVMFVLLGCGANDYYADYEAEDYADYADYQAEDYEAEEYDEEPQEAGFRAITQINENMPYFTFHIRFDQYPTPNDYGYFRPLYGASILITDDDGEVIQLIDGILLNTDNIETWGVRFGDFNLNGYLDFSVLKKQSGSSGTGVHYVWLWDVNQGQFVMHYQLMDIVRYNMYFSSQWNDYGLLHVYHYYRMNVWANSAYSYENGEFVRVRHTSGQYLFNPESAAWYAHVEISDLITGETRLEIIEIDFWYWGETNRSILNSDARIVEKVDIGTGEYLIFRFDQWIQITGFVYDLVITIMSPCGYMLQQIGFLEQRTTPFAPQNDEKRQPTFVDLNFDGYLDLRIWREILGEHDGWSVISHYNFIWDGRQFVYSEKFSSLSTHHIASDKENDIWFSWNTQHASTVKRFLFNQRDFRTLAIREVMNFAYPPLSEDYIIIYDATAMVRYGHEMILIQELGHFYGRYGLTWWQDFNGNGYADLAFGDTKWLWCPDEWKFVAFED